MNVRFLCAVLLLGQALVFPPGVWGQVYEEIFDFTEARTANTVNKGGQPMAALIQARDGSFYGTTSRGGIHNAGTIFRVSPVGELTTLVEFDDDAATILGSFPEAALVQGSDGNFYGTTSDGGALAAGTIFRLTSSGVLTRLVEFTGDDGANKGSQPLGALIEGPDGFLYGTTSGGGSGGLGTVFKMTPQGVLTTLVEFQGSPGGAGPAAGLVFGSDGNFYGTTLYGGASDIGTIFRMTPAGVVTTLVEFTGNGELNKGSEPRAALVQASDGHFYGTTSGGGANDGGTLFRMTMAGALTTLVEFTDNGAVNKGRVPSAGLLQGSDGVLYGTTAGGGTDDVGTIFKMTLAGVLTTIVDIDVNETALPSASLIQASDGNFYGTTAGDSAVVQFGTVFQLSPAGVLTTVVEFTGVGLSQIASTPTVALVEGDDGRFYGMASRGGAKNLGTVFRVSPAGVLNQLLSFTGNDAQNKGTGDAGGLVLGSDGNFYGTTASGGIGFDPVDSLSGQGTVFVMTPAGVLTTLVEFTGMSGDKPGAFPVAPLVEGTDGFFYGTTIFGGAGGFGTVFKVSPAGAFTSLATFTNNGAMNKGRHPLGALVLGDDGNFYGTTSGGGANDSGTVFRMTPVGDMMTLVEFGSGGSNKGSNPLAALVQLSGGDFFGTTSSGGTLNRGTVFRMTPAGALTTLVEFTGNGAANKGRGPAAPLALGTDGNLYGTTSAGGASDFGTIFKMTPAGTLTTVREFVGTSIDDRLVKGLTAGTDGNLYGATAGPDGTIYRLVLPGAPTAIGLRATSQSPSSVLVEAQVNPRGAATNVVLEHGTNGIDFPNILPVAANLTGFQTRLAGSTLEGLIPGSTYFFRFRAVSSAGETLSPVQSFSTLAEPIATNLPASEIGPGSARFNGTVNARNFDTTVVFEWGLLGTSFPNVAPAVPGTIAGNQDTAVGAAVAGLPQGGTIYYRLRATNAAGTTISGVSSFSTVSATTTAATGVGVKAATFNATVNTFGQTATVIFKYGTDGVNFDARAVATPTTIAASGATAVSARVDGLGEASTIHYLVSVSLGGTVTDAAPVSFTTQTNQPPAALADLIFYSGQVVVDPLANDSDPNEASNASLLLDPVLVVPPNASRGVASVTGDRRSISYNPQFNVLDDDVLIYRVVDPVGAGSEAQVRFVAFSKRAGLYGGRIVSIPREGQIAVQVGGAGAISTSFMNWPNAVQHLGESFVLKGVFDQRGVFTRTLNSPTGAVLALTLTLDPDAPEIHGTFEETVNGSSTTGVITFTLTKNAGTGGLAESGLRTGFLSPPLAEAVVMVDGFVRLAVGKDKRRGGRFAGRLPDGEPFLTGAKAQGRSYVLTRKLEQGGVFTGIVRAIDGSTGARGMMGNLAWKKRASSRAKFHRNGVDAVLALSGVAYPAVERGGVPAIGLGTSSPNARLRLGSGDIGGPFRDLLLHLGPGRVQIIGPDPAQTGPDISLGKLQVQVNGSNAAFSGRLRHPATGQLVPFRGAFRAPFDGEPGQGRGVFRGPSAAGAVRIEAN